MSSLRTTVIGCGGAGSNITAYLKNGMNDEEFIEYLTIDTSDANKKDGIPFCHIKSAKSNAQNLSGAGGIRGVNFEDILPGCKKFVDDQSLHIHDGVVVLIFSTSGGSGNVIAAGLLHTLLAYDIAVYCIYVHDNSNAQFAENCVKATETLFNISQEYDVVLPVNYFVNTIDKDIVNKSILDEFRMIMKFHDTDNLNEIDNQDMKFFYQSIKYTANPIPSGVVAIAVTDIKHVENAVEKHEVLVARSLTNSDFDPIKIGQINQNKNGTSNCGTEVALLLLNNFDKQYGLVKSAFAVYNKPIKKFAIDENVKVSKGGMVF